MADLNAALIGLLGLMTGGYVNNFLAEDYRRFRDGQALAGALAGELESHAEAFDFLKRGLENMIPVATDKGLDLTEWPIPPSPLFDENAAKVGLLGPQSARDVAYVYENIRAFRQNFHMLSKDHRNMLKEWAPAMIVGCIAAIQRAETRGRPLIETLKSHAAEEYRNRPQTRDQIRFALKFGAAAVFVLFVLSRIFG
jgi:hypothetical protein